MTLPKQRLQISPLMKMENGKRKLTIEQQKRISSIAKSMQKSMDLQMEPIKNAIEGAKRSFPDMSAIKSLTEQAQRINENFIPDMTLFNEAMKKSEGWGEQMKNIEFPIQKTPVFLPPNHQKPMHPDDRKFLAEFLGDQIKPPSSQEQPVFCWNTMALKFPEGIIHLSSIEKNICSFLFKNPKKKVFGSEEVENAVYDKVLLSSSRMKQAIKRLNKKVCAVTKRPFLSWSSEMVEVLI